MKNHNVFMYIFRETSQDYETKIMKFIREWRKVDSSWVHSIAVVVVGKRYGVAISFLDGFSCWYPTTEIDDFNNLKRVKSVGRSVRNKYYDLPYEEI